MIYRQTFDHLGNPVYRQAKTPLAHKIAQCAGLAACAVGLVLLLVVR